MPNGLSLKPSTDETGEGDEDEDGEEIETLKEPGTNEENLTYLLNLIIKSENKYTTLSYPV